MTTEKGNRCKSCTVPLLWTLIS